MTYGELDRSADRVAGALAELGVRPGDRVGIWSDKSARTVAAMQGVLRLGAAYVPVDPLSPPSRALKILTDCAARAVVTTAERAADVKDVGACLYVDDEEWRGVMARAVSPPAPEPDVGADDLAYILYTSGSTGDPKGVCISHRAALAFVDWAAGELAATPADRFANHAPFHFDLSVLDLYAAFRSGGSVHLIPHEVSFAPKLLVDFLRRERITVWYSVPSALILMMRDGGLLDIDPGPLRAVLFAGEPFPVKHLRTLRERWPDVRFLNLYGPTETNVCTYHEVGAIPAEQTRPVPIGTASCGDRVWARRSDGAVAQPGEEGELVVAGPTVMLGYWGRPPQDGPYPTGDVVVQGPDGAYDYLGRRDNMVKVRGYRVELGEIEAALLAHPAVADAAVVAVGSGTDSSLVAYVVPDDSRGPTLLDLKRHSAERLPRHMILDEVRPLDGLPRTGNGKVDRRRLAAEAEALAR
jgi:clorobiocin biosynthesis protein CloN4